MSLFIFDKHIIRFKLTLTFSTLLYFIHLSSFSQKLISCFRGGYVVCCMLYVVCCMLYVVQCTYNTYNIHANLDGWDHNLHLVQSIKEVPNLPKSSH